MLNLARRRQPRLASLAVAALLLSSAISSRAQIADIIGNVTREAYKKLKTYSSEGTITTVIDLSETPAGKAARIRGFNGGELGADSAFMKPQTRTTTISIKLRREGEYRITWRQKVGAAHTNEGVVWNAGEGDFIQVPERGVGRAPDRQLALSGATGLSGGASHTIPSLFYGFSPDSLSEIQGLSQQPDETMGDDLCFVLAGKLNGQGVRLWIRKQDYLIVQRKQIIGGANVLPSLTDDEARKAIEAAGATATPEAIEKQKKLRETRRETMLAVKGHSTLRLTDIVVDKPIPVAELKPEPPAIPPPNPAR
ncbi:MAG: hypothetical protein ACKVJX_03315 [Verrucomicrobiia bacterium]|jgi:hypothetical protein